MEVEYTSSYVYAGEYIKLHAALALSFVSVAFQLDSSQKAQNLTAKVDELPMRKREKIKRRMTREATQISDAGDTKNKKNKNSFID